MSKKSLSTICQRNLSEQLPPSSGYMTKKNVDLAKTKDIAINDTVASSNHLNFFLFSLRVI